ncbi:MAG: 4Fe-4S dicluster domain-containing protein [Candidatus Omnitrophica bacterium]|nr:4Fe-4S dicluster domain-containing protein [Candidatus Omnitrophota bacterium]
MDIYFLRTPNLARFYERIAHDYELFVPKKTDAGPKIKCEHGVNLPADEYLLNRFQDVNKDEIVFNAYRSIEPVRSFFTHLKEQVCNYFNNKEIKPGKPVAVSGVKNCDLYSLKIQDFVFLDGNEPDPFYKARRESALIISGDCPAFKESCFCRAFDINPYADEGFDFNLSPIQEGYLVDAASQKAKSIAATMKDILVPATGNQLQEKADGRERAVKKLDEHLSKHKIPKKETLREIVLAGYNSKVWNEQMRTCVECGGCVFMCDTCHCFLLFDEESSASAKRMRIWDGCLYKNFTRVAGGANPLKMRYMRLRNRYLKKFDFFTANMGTQACCGCGRCIDVCPGKIDIRYILRRLHEEKHIQSI